MGTVKESRYVTARTSLKLDPSLKLWIWCQVWGSHGSVWVNVPADEFEFHIKRHEHVAASRERPTWTPEQVAQ